MEEFHEFHFFIYYWLVGQGSFAEFEIYKYILILL
jgi:hypothetical protein